MIPLGLLESGSHAEFVRGGQNDDSYKGQGLGMLRRVEEMGLLPGTDFEVIRNEGHGPILLRIDGTRVALGRSLSMKLVARPL